MKVIFLFFTLLLCALAVQEKIEAEDADFGSAVSYITLDDGQQGAILGFGYWTSQKSNSYTATLLVPSPTILARYACTITSGCEITVQFYSDPNFPLLGEFQSDKIQLDYTGPSLSDPQVKVVTHPQLSEWYGYFEWWATSASHQKVAVDYLILNFCDNGPGTCPDLELAPVTPTESFCGAGEFLDTSGCTQICPARTIDQESITNNNHSPVFTSSIGQASLSTQTLTIPVSVDQVVDASTSMSLNKDNEDDSINCDIIREQLSSTAPTIGTCVIDYDVAVPFDLFLKCASVTASDETTKTYSATVSLTQSAPNEFLDVNKRDDDTLTTVLEKEIKYNIPFKVEATSTEFIVREVAGNTIRIRMREITYSVADKTVTMIFETLTATGNDFNDQPTITCGAVYDDPQTTILSQDPCTIERSCEADECVCGNEDDTCKQTFKIILTDVDASDATSCKRESEYDLDITLTLTEGSVAVPFTLDGAFDMCAVAEIVSVNPTLTLDATELSLGVARNWDFGITSDTEFSVTQYSCSVNDGTGGGAMCTNNSDNGGFPTALKSSWNDPATENCDLPLGTYTVECEAEVLFAGSKKRSIDVRSERVTTTAQFTVSGKGAASSSSTVAVAAVVGAVVAVAAIGFLAFFIVKRRRRDQDNTTTQSPLEQSNFDLE